MRLDALTRCLHAVKAAFEAHLSLPLSEYRNFSTSEWTRLIHTIIILFRICGVTSTTPGWRFGLNDQRKQFGIYFESLSFRMGELSAVGDKTAPPTVFCMFEAVLPLVRQLYETLVAGLSQEPSPAAASYTEASDLPMPRCPILGTQITQTGYWELLGNTSNMYGEAHNARSSSEGYDLISHLGDWDAWETGFPIGNDFTEFGTSSNKV